MAPKHRTLTQIAQQLAHQQWLFLLRLLQCKNCSVLNSRTPPTLSTQALVSEKSLPRVAKVLVGDSQARDEGVTKNGN